MRKWNALISMIILVLFLVHAAAGGMQLLGALPGGDRLLTLAARALMTLIVIHVLIGIRLTADTLKAMKRSGVSYFRENKVFWIRRISGFAVFIFMIFHLLIFSGKNDGVYRLKFFGGMQLATQILLALSTAVHVVTSIKPLMLALGGRKLKDYAVDILLIASVLLLFAGAAFIIYYLRWNMM